MLAYAPPEVSEEMHNYGIFLCGGSSALPGLTETLSTLTGLSVTPISDPALALVSAIGKLCGEREKVAKLLNLKQI